jgi:ADP-ribose pyrophosphatase
MTGLRGPTHPQVDILDKKDCYQGFFRLEKYRLRHRLYDGAMSSIVERELFERGHAAAALLYDPLRDEVVILEQFRIGALEIDGGPWLYEIVAGMIEHGENAEAVVRREALEEAGCSILALEFICEYLVSPGGTSERISLYCAMVDAEGVGGVHGLADEHEDIRVQAVSFDEVWQWFEQGRINSASPIIALQWLAMHRERLRRKWLSQP